MADNTKCKTCAYRGGYDEDIYCDYMLMKGERRGCKGGKECTKYARGRANLRTDGAYIRKSAVFEEGNDGDAQ